MPVGYRKQHPVIGFATNTDSTIAKAGTQGWPVALGRYNLVEAARKTAVYRDALDAAGHPEDVRTECLALSSVTKAIVIAETDEQAWEIAERQLRGFMNFTYSVATRRRLEDTRSMKELWDDTVEGPVDIANATFTAPEWIQASAFVGSPDTVARQMLEYADAGIEGINARFVYGDFDAAEAWRGFTLFAEKVMPLVGAQQIPAPGPGRIRPEHLGPGAAPSALAELFR
jgi:alkanesulfonate monooxygenase SsuD/methylene tetrahydromethanopterin reductase-like flavin-dependent oxidoreductase (luciferase family)